MAQTINNIVEGFKNEDSFFNLLVDNGQMRAEEKPKEVSLKIVRPAALGGVQTNAAFIN